MDFLVKIEDLSDTMSVDLIELMKTVLRLQSMAIFIDTLDDPRPIELKKKAALILEESGLLKSISPIIHSIDHLVWCKLKSDELGPEALYVLVKTNT